MVGVWFGVVRCGLWVYMYNTTNPSTQQYNTLTQDGAPSRGKRKAAKDEEEVDDLDRALKRVKGDTLASIATLSRSRRYQEHVAVRCFVCSCVLCLLIVGMG